MELLAIIIDEKSTALSHAKGYRLLDLLRTHFKLALSHTPPVPSPFPRSANNRTLQRLVLDQNQLTQVGARVVQMAGVREDHVTIISMPSI